MLLKEKIRELNLCKRDLIYIDRKGDAVSTVPTSVKDIDREELEAKVLSATKVMGAYEYGYRLYRIVLL